MNEEELLLQSSEAYIKGYSAGYTKGREIEARQTMKSFCIANDKNLELLQKIEFLKQQLSFYAEESNWNGNFFKGEGNGGRWVELNDGSKVLDPTPAPFAAAQDALRS